MGGKPSQIASEGFKTPFAIAPLGVFALWATHLPYFQFWGWFCKLSDRTQTRKEEASSSVLEAVGLCPIILSNFLRGL